MYKYTFFGNKGMIVTQQQEQNIIIGTKDFELSYVKDLVSNLKKGKFDMDLEFSNGLRIVKVNQGNYKDDPDYFSTFGRCSKYRSALKFYMNDKLVGVFALNEFKALTEAQKIKRLNKWVAYHQELQIVC